MTKILLKQINGQDSVGMKKKALMETNVMQNRYCISTETRTVIMGIFTARTTRNSG